MTPRLRILSIGLALSLVYAIYDYVQRNNAKKAAKVEIKKPKKRARTAGVSADRMKIRERNRAYRNNNNSFVPDKSNFKPSAGLPEISDAVLNLEGWSRNPFIEVYEAPIVKKSDSRYQQDAVEDEKIKERTEISTLDGLIIETAIRMGEKAYVTINGQTFTEGDQINNALIEKIENEQITFKIGTTRIIKDVGT
ncbi:MAG: hypothetical protein CMG60_08830 [Candidatus Marinimicrobia bacterium]|nr:hypothetical protein [Candidatus Neomarinimicrobiota bacterium]